MSRGAVAAGAGVAVGIGLSMGRFPVLAGAVEGVARTAARIETNLATLAVGQIGEHSSKWSVVAAVVLPVMAPGLTAFGLAAAANAGTGLRRVFASLFVVLGVGSFFVLPAREAVGVALFCLAVGVVASVAADWFVVFPLAAAATMLAGVWLPLMLATHGSFAEAQARQVNVLLFHNGVSADPAFARWMLFAVAMAPFIGAAGFLWRSATGDRSPL